MIFQLTVSISLFLIGIALFLINQQLKRLSK
jgi:hypothetical protein